MIPQTTEPPPAEPGFEAGLLATELDPRNQPTPEKNALQVSLLWGDSVVSTAQVDKPGPVRVGHRLTRPTPALEVDGGLPAATFTIARLEDGEAEIVMPDGASAAVRERSGAINERPTLVDAEAPFPAQAYRLRLGERLVYRAGTLTVVAQFVRGDAALGRGRMLDWFFPAIFTVSALLHFFFVAATFIAPDPDDLRLEDLAKNQQRYAKLLLRAKAPQRRPRKLDLSGKKGGAKARKEEGKFGKRDRKPSEKAASKAGAPRVDPKKRERDRKIAMRSGLLAMLGGDNQQATSRVLGPGGLGTGINEAMGGLRGTTMGDAGGAGGLGTRGNKRGGGGRSLGIGGLGTRGRGTGGDGNIDLGKRGKARTRIVPGRTVVKGSLTKAEISRVIRRNLPRFKFCYEKQLAANPDLAGKVAVSFTIAPTGAVARASVQESSMNEAAVESCVARVMKSLKFPKPRGGGIVVVTYPFVFAAT